MKTKTTLLNMIPIQDLERYLICAEGFVYDTKLKRFKDGSAVETGKWYRQIGLSNPNGKHTPYYLHRLLAQHFLPAPTPEQTQVDHIDGNGLNNQLSNLRWVTLHENLVNRKAWGESKYMGVHKHAQGKWVADIRLNGKTKYLGLYDDEISAARAYNVEAIKAGYLHYNKGI